MVCNSPTRQGDAVNAPAALAAIEDAIQALQRLREALRGQPAAHPPPPPPPAKPDDADDDRPACSFDDCGGTWFLRFEYMGTVERGHVPKTCTGMEVIQRLIARTRSSIKATDLSYGYDTPEDGEQDRLDTQARFANHGELKRQLRASARRIGDARKDDVRRSAEAEHALLLTEYQATTFRGKPKVDPKSPGERARQRVKNQITRAIKSIRRSGLPHFASHLQGAIRQDFQSFYYEPGIGGPKVHTNRAEPRSALDTPRTYQKL